MAAPAKRFCGGGGPVFDRKFSGAGEPDAGGSAGASLDGDLTVTTELDAGTSHGRRTWAATALRILEQHRHLGCYSQPLFLLTLLQLESTV